MFFDTKLLLAIFSFLLPKARPFIDQPPSDTCVQFHGKSVYLRPSSVLLGIAYLSLSRTSACWDCGRQLR